MIKKIATFCLIFLSTGTSVVFAASATSSSYQIDFSGLPSNSATGQSSNYSTNLTIQDNIPGYGQSNNYQLCSGLVQQAYGQCNSVAVPPPPAPIIPPSTSSTNTSTATPSSGGSGLVLKMNNDSEKSNAATLTNPDGSLVLDPSPEAILTPTDTISNVAEPSAQSSVPDHASAPTTKTPSTKAPNTLPTSPSSLPTATTAATPTTETTSPSQPSPSLHPNQGNPMNQAAAITIPSLLLGNFPILIKGSQPIIQRPSVMVESVVCIEDKIMNFLVLLIILLTILLIERQLKVRKLKEKLKDQPQRKPHRKVTSVQ